MLTPFIKGITLGLLLSISVGPVIFAVIKQSINNGRAGGYAFVAGVSASDISIVLICNLFTSLFNNILEHEKIIAIIGSCFLMAMGIYNIFFRKYNISEDGLNIESVLRKRDVAGIFFAGYFMNLLNPGAFLFWFAASATIIGESKTYDDPVNYRWIVFATCLSIVLLADTIKVVLANRIREKLTPHNIHLVNIISGIILIIFGIVIISRVLI